MTERSEDALKAAAMAMQNAELSDGEGNTYRLFDLLDFGGENKAVIITRQLARAALEAGCAGLVAENARLREALDPFARVAAIEDAANPDASDDVPCRDFFPGIWPTRGDCRKARAALRGDREQGEG
jgi:hypothetical protein